jgi:hypothetical protein
VSATPPHKMDLRLRRGYHNRSEKEPKTAASGNLKLRLELRLSADDSVNKIRPDAVPLASKSEQHLRSSESVLMRL